MSLRFIEVNRTACPDRKSLQATALLNISILLTHQWTVCHCVTILINFSKLFLPSNLHLPVNLQCTRCLVKCPWWTASTMGLSLFWEVTCLTLYGPTDRHSVSVVLLLILWQEETDSPCEGVLLGLGDLLALIFRVRKPDKELLNQQSAVGKHVLLPVDQAAYYLVA